MWSSAENLIVEHESSSDCVLFKRGPTSRQFPQSFDDKHFVIKKNQTCHPFCENSESFFPFLFILSRKVFFLCFFLECQRKILFIVMCCERICEPRRVGWLKTADVFLSAKRT